MAGYLTTHVLDTALGCPAEGLKIELFRISGVERHLLKTLTTNNDGRTDEQILPEAEFEVGDCRSDAIYHELHEKARFRILSTAMRE